jgi:hypothetical protein
VILSRAFIEVLTAAFYLHVGDADALYLGAFATKTRKESWLSCFRG